MVAGEGGLDVLAAALHQIHDLPVADCPSDASDEALLARAARRVAEGSVAVDRIDVPYQRYPPAKLLELAAAARPAGSELVVIHGDARLDHLHLDDATGAATWTGLDHRGVGDPYRDLATLCLDLVAGGAASEVLGRFLEVYGIEHPDIARLDFHILLDQLLR